MQYVFIATFDGRNETSSDPVEKRETNARILKFGGSCVSCIEGLERTVVPQW